MSAQNPSNDQGDRDPSDRRPASQSAAESASTPPVPSEPEFIGPMPAARPPQNDKPTPFWISLYNHNPFYVISALLMLFGVRAAYGELEIGHINCWVVMGSLAGYTLLLGVIGVLIVRLGKVWEDARSIFLVMLLMFLAVSVSADDLFVKVTSAGEGTALVIFGYLFSALLTEVVFFATNIRFGWRYRVPYHLFLMLFFITPWWCSPEIHARSSAEMEWTLFLFPAIAGGILLTLLPAVWGGPDYVKENGTPWSWPMFPWSAFFMLIAGVVLRSYALTMTFGPTGPIWRESSSGAMSIVFNTIWGPHFLLPVMFAILILLLEGSLVTKNRKLSWGVMCCTPLLLLFSIPIGSGKAFHTFLFEVTSTVGSPIWIGLLMQTGLYAWAWYRRLPLAIEGTLASILLFSVISRSTISPETLTDPHPLPFLAVGVILTLIGLMRRSSFASTAAALCSILGFWLYAPGTGLEPWRMTICYFSVWAVVVVFGVIYDDWFAGVLRMLAGFQAPIASFILLTEVDPMQVSIAEKLLSILLLAGIYFGIAKYWNSMSFMYGAFGTSGVLAYGAAVIGFHEAARLIGYPAMTALTFSVGTLLLGVLISAHKANWFRNKELGTPR